MGCKVNGDGVGHFAALIARWRIGDAQLVFVHRAAPAIGKVKCTASFRIAQTAGEGKSG
jgi:hypothetical protein